MECPKCKGKLETKQHGDEISIQRCSSCYGMLVEEHMLAGMLNSWMSETILDTGPASIGKKYDQIDDIKCPLCNISMDKIVDPVQTHIWMESCPACYRIFLDAGEFSDLKYDTFSDKFKSLIKGRRNLG